MKLLKILSAVFLFLFFCKPAYGQDSSRKIAALTTKKFVGIKYDYLYFDEKEKEGWHSASLELGREVREIPMVARLNYAHRFNESALQAEVDAYPKISKKVYAYLNVGYSNDSLLFPGFKAGTSVYVSLPKAFEVEAGFRLLRFKTNTWIYTAALSKYYKSYWFSFITYVVPVTGNVTQSYFLKTRYYFDDTDFLEIAAGTGVSPDDRNNNSQLTSNNKLSSRNIGIIYKRTVSKVNVFMISTGWLKQETQLKQHSNQYSFGVGLQRLL